MTGIEAYPWANPTEEQKAMFDSLSPEQQLDMLRQAIADGIESGDAGELDMEDIIQKSRQKAGLLSSKDL